MRRRLLRFSVSLLCALVVLAAVYLLFFHRLADRDLWSSHEARAGMDAQTMLDDGAWGMPRLFSGEPELQKPPLYYWLVAAIALLRGGAVDAWAVRLPATVAAVLCLAGLVVFGRARGRIVAGLAAAIVLATALHFTWMARIGRIDMPLTLTVGVAVGAVYLSRAAPLTASMLSRLSPAALVVPDVPAAKACLARIEPRSLSQHAFAACKLMATGCAADSRESMAPLVSLSRNAVTARNATTFLVIAYVAVAAGVLLKGPIGAVLPIAVVGVHLLIEGALPAPYRIRAWLRLFHELGLWWGVPLVLALTLPWFLWADAATHGDLYRVFILRHNVERGLGDGDLKVHPWWFYGPQFVSDFLPWSILLPVALFLCWRRGTLRADCEARLGLAWFLTVTVVLSCASFKRADYLLPAYPGAALFLGCVFANEERRWREAGPRMVWAVLGLTPCLLAATMTLVWLVRVEHGLPLEEPFRDYRRFAAAVRTRAPQPDEIVFFRTEAHALAFHVGRPMAVLVEWNELQERVTESGARYVVMPEESAGEAPQVLPNVHFEEVLRNTDLSAGRHERPLVLLRATSSETLPMRNAALPLNRFPLAARHSSLAAN